MTSTYTRLHYKISKARYINRCQTQREVYNFIYLPRGTSENIKVEYRNTRIIQEASHDIFSL